MSFETGIVGARPAEAFLMHHGIRGMKHGRRRFQNEDGTWTEAGLEARRKREGFGESRKARRLEKKVARAEKKQARRAAREEARAEYAERQRKKKLSNLTDDEMRQKLERAKMEAEYRNLTKRGSLIETGGKLIGKYLDYKANKEQRAIDLNRQKIELERLRTQRVQAKEATTQAKYRIKTSENEAKTAEEEAKKMAADVKGGLKIKRKAELKREKTNYRNTTTRGAIGNYLNAKAKGAGQAAGEYKQNKQHVKSLIKGQQKVDKYNAKRPKGQKKLQAEETAWDRQLTEARERRANAEAVARLNVEKEKWRSKRRI